jgi:hypothetical protein
MRAFTFGDELYLISLRNDIDRMKGHTARSRTILQTLLLSDLFDRMTPTIGHKA